MNLRSLSIPREHTRGFGNGTATHALESTGEGAFGGDRSTECRHRGRNQGERNKRGGDHFESFG